MTELELLQHPLSAVAVSGRVDCARKNREGIQFAKFDPSHIPGPLRLSSVREKGKKLRRVYVPSDKDAVQSFYPLEATIRHAINRTQAHGTLRGTGVYTAVKETARIIRDIQPSCIAHTDIKACFDNIPQREAIQLFPEQHQYTRNYLSQLAARYNQLTDYTKGFPQGHPVSPYVVELFLTHVLPQHTQCSAYIVRYIDDLLIIARSAQQTLQILSDVTRALYSHGIKLSANKTRIQYLQNEGHVDTLGHRIHCNRRQTWITPHPQKVSQWAQKLKECEFLEDRQHKIQGFRSAYSAADPQSVERMIKAALSAVDDPAFALRGNPTGPATLMPTTDSTISPEGSQQPSGSHTPSGATSIAQTQQCVKPRGSHAERLEVMP